MKLSGWGSDPKTGLSTITPEVIATHNAAHPLAARFSTQKMQSYDVLPSLWRDTNASGSFACGSNYSNKKHDIRDKRKNNENYSDDSQTHPQCSRFRQ